MKLRIKEILKEKKMTTVTLAGKLGITQPNANNMVNGKTTPSLDTLEKVAIALNVPITELFYTPKKNTATLNCPHCGKPIDIEVK